MSEGNLLGHIISKSGIKVNFNYNQHILDFMKNANVFKDETIDEDEHDKAL